LEYATSAHAQEAYPLTRTSQIALQVVRTSFGIHLRECIGSCFPPLEETNVDWIVTYISISPEFKREIRNRWRLLVSVGLTLQGIFLNFQEHLLNIYSTPVFKKLLFKGLQQKAAFLCGKVPAINILLSEHKSGQTRQAANNLLLLHVNIRQMSTINQSAFLIWNRATVRTLQYSI